MVRCWAWDLLNNSRAERTFVVRHWRDTKGGGYELEDERDVYELVANMAARRVRACLEEIIDADIIDKAIDQCRLTLKQGGKNVPIQDRASKMLVEFAEFGVTQDMIEKRLGNKLDAVSENQLASLRRVFKSLRDGVGQREDYFKGSNLEEPKFSEPVQGKAPAPAPAPAPAQPMAPASTAPTQEQKPTAPAPAPASSPLRLLRDLCRVSKIKEGVLLGFLTEIGASDGSASTLEELQMTNPAAVASAINGWADLSAKIKAAQGADKLSKP